MLESDRVSISHPLGEVACPAEAAPALFRPEAGSSGHALPGPAAGAGGAEEPGGTNHSSITFHIASSPAQAGGTSVFTTPCPLRDRREGAAAL